MATARRRVVRRGSDAEQAPRGRRDPKPRHVNGVRPWGIVLNKDPDYDYHFWAETDTAHGLSEAMSVGWEPVEMRDQTKEPDAERLQGGATSKLGEPIRSRGLVLCRRPKNAEAALDESDRRQAFMGQLSRDLGIAKGTAQQRWNRRGIVGADAPELDPSITEEVNVTHRTLNEANPYPAQAQE